jgi:hypothetical protein
VEGECQYVTERILDGTFDEGTQRYKYLAHWEVYPDFEDTLELEHLTVFKRFRKLHVDSPKMFPPTKTSKHKTILSANEYLRLKGLRPEQGGALMNDISSCAISLVHHLRDFSILISVSILVQLYILFTTVMVYSPRHLGI